MRICESNKTFLNIFGSYANWCDSSSGIAGKHILTHSNRDLAVGMNMCLRKESGWTQVNGAFPGKSLVGVIKKEIVFGS